MLNNYLMTGFIAGCVSAVLYVTVVTGSLFGLMLFYLAPLPIFIAGLGWGVVSAAIASGSGFAVTSITSGIQPGLLFFATVGIPVIVLTHFALLSRPIPDTDPPQSEWYPLGRILIWIGLISCVLVGLAVLIAGPGAAAFQNTVREFLTELFAANERLKTQLEAGGQRNVEQIVDLLVWIMPPASAVLWMITTLLNLWIASWAVEKSGRTRRPRDILRDIDLPRLAGPGLAFALIVSFAGGLIGIIGTSLAAVLIIAFVIQGLAVVHVLTAGHAFRPVLLTGTYLLLLMTSWIGIFLIGGIGLAETLFGLRHRFASRGGPPAPA